MDQNSHKRDPLLASKIVGALCVAGLIFLFGRWGAEALTTRGMPDEHHGAEGEHSEEAVMQAYTIEVASNDVGGEEEAGPDVGALMHAADPAKGENVFKKCKACHSIEAGKNGTGPSLNAVVGRQPGTEAGFEYDDAMHEFGQEHAAWTAELLFEFLGDVKGTVPGTKMSFPGIKDPGQRADLIAYLMGGEFNADDFSASAEVATADAAEEGDSEANDAATAADAEAADTANADAAAAGGEYAMGDPAKGETVFKKCKACHSVEAGKNGTGPSLFGVVGRQPGTEAGYKYDEAMMEFGQANPAWTPALLDQFLGDVKGTVKGTKMSFPGVKKPEQRADLIAYLNSFH